MRCSVRIISVCAMCLAGHVTELSYASDEISSTSAASAEGLMEQAAINLETGDKDSAVQAQNLALAELERLQQQVQQQTGRVAKPSEKPTEEPATKDPEQDPETKQPKNQRRATPSTGSERVLESDALQGEITDWRQSGTWGRLPAAWRASLATGMEQQVSPQYRYAVELFYRRLAAWDDEREGR